MTKIKQTPPPKPRARGETIALGIALVVATFAAHFPAIFAGFVWDDDVLLYKNPMIMAADGLHRIWFSTEGADYWPLTGTTFWMEWRLWGSNPLPYHVANIALHAAAAVLMWRVVRRLNVSPLTAWLAALIFAVHPVTVESVAWIAERKNVLSMVFYLLALLAYLRFEDHERRRDYALALLAAAAALLAKTSVVMLPIVLLLLAWWKRRRLRRSDLWRTLPFFLLSLAMGVLTASLQQQAVRPEGVASRIAAAGWVVWFYIDKLLMPFGLAAIYPRWQVDGGRLMSFVPLALLIAGLVLLWRDRRTWGRAAFAAMAYFVITLAPVLGLLSMAWARFSLVADHLQYVSMGGPIIGAAALLARPLTWQTAARPGGARTPGIVVICGIVIALGTLTWRQAGLYRSSESLWAHSVSINDGAAVAHYNLGLAEEIRGARADAIRDYTRAIELQPGYAEAYNNRGIALASTGDRARALSDFTRVIELRPEYAEAYNNRGGVYGNAGENERALQDYDKAIALKPDHADGYYNRAVARYGLKQYDAAWADVKACEAHGGTVDPAFLHALSRAKVRDAE